MTDLTADLAAIATTARDLELTVRADGQLVYWRAVHVDRPPTLTILDGSAE